LVIGDVVVLTLGWGVPSIFATSVAPDRRALSAIVAGVLTMIVLYRGGLYHSRVCALRSALVLRVILATAVGTTAFVACQWLAGDVTPRVAAVGAAFVGVGLVAERWRFDRWVKTRRSGGRSLRRVILIGTDAGGAELMRILTDEPELGYRVAGVVGANASDDPWCGLESCPDAAGLAGLADRVGASGVILVASAAEPSVGHEAVCEALRVGLHVQVWPGLNGVSSRRIRLTPVSRLPMFYVEPESVAPWQLAAKRMVDVIVSVVLLPFVAPVLLACACWIKLEDGGPVLYRHQVIGRFGTPITVLKLRTMVPDASSMLVDVAGLNERRGGPLFKATNDPRVTRAGRVLRATSLDELPQLWNVLKGSMSLVGPRFALPAEVEQFDEDLRRRHEMRPGMTGLWQSEARDNPSFSAYRRLDLFYVDNWSLTLDFEILVNTLYSVVVRSIRAVLGAVRAPTETSTDLGGYDEGIVS
jgi:exopolysaccharide biosynthesis polyprenyl glycosylphosphotransferase